MIGGGLSARAQAWIKAELRKAAHGAALRVANLALSGTGPMDYEVEGRAGGADEPSYQDRARMMQHYGFRSRPAARSLVATLCHMAASSQRVIVADDTPGEGPDDQEEGEVEIYSSTGQRIRLRHSGVLTLETSGGALVELLDDGSVVLHDKDGGRAELKNKRLSVTEDVALRHLLAGGTVPTASTTNPNVIAVVASGTDTMAQISFGVVNNPAVGTLLNLSYAAPFAVAPVALVGYHAGKAQANWSTSAGGVTITTPDPLPVGSYAVTILSIGRP